MARIRLIRKYASVLNGFDLAGVAVGDMLMVTQNIADMLIREGWAEPVSGASPPETSGDRRRSLDAD